MIIAAVVGAFSALAIWMLARPFVLSREVPETTEHTPAPFTAGTSATAPRPGHGTPRSSRPRRLRAVLALTLATASALAVSATLVGSIEDRPTSAAVATPDDAPSTAAGGPPGAAATDALGARLAEPTVAQIAAVEAAVERVRANPQGVAAHLALARAYTAAQQPQLATVEYLAATRLDGDNAEANTALALVALRSGRPRAAKAMVDRALAAHPDHPEALYTRGLLNAMGLDRPAAARRDLEAYLDAAPFGSHRLSVETLLILLDAGGAK